MIADPMPPPEGLTVAREETGGRPSPPPEHRPAGIAPPVQSDSGGGGPVDPSAVSVVQTAPHREAAIAPILRREEEEVPMEQAISRKGLLQATIAHEPEIAGRELIIPLEASDPTNIRPEPKPHGEDVDSLPIAESDIIHPPPSVAAESIKARIATRPLSISEAIVRDTVQLSAPPAASTDKTVDRGLESPPRFLPPVGMWVSRCDFLSGESVGSASEEDEAQPSFLAVGLGVSSPFEFAVVEVPVGEADLEELVDEQATYTKGVMRRLAMPRAPSEKEQQITSEESVCADDAGVQARVRSEPSRFKTESSEEEVAARDVLTNTRVLSPG
jgi:hypothetical protein